jgi:hypothetical protein
LRFNESAGQRLNEFIVATLADHDPGQRGADLTGKEAFRLRQGAGRGRDVHVIEDHGHGLAAQLQGAACDPLAAQRGDPPPGRGRPGKGDLIDARVTDQQLRDLTIGGDDVEHARRQPDRLGDLSDQVTLTGRFR